MSVLLTYAVGSALVLAVLWGGYRLLMRGQKTFRVNRILLDLTLYFSAFAPVLMSMVSIPVPEQAFGMVGLMALPEVTVYGGGAVSAADDGFAVWLPVALAAVYIAGVLLALLLRVVIPVATVLHLLRRGCRYRTMVGGRAVRVVSVPESGGRRVEPMSWFGIIFLPAGEDYGEDSYVMRHEMAHIRLRHSFLLLQASLLVCLQWFNPAAWLLLRDLRQNCEFEADDEVLSSGADSKGYQRSLVGQAARGMAVSIANPFRNSSLYRRIVMIQKAVPGPKVYARLLYVLPVAFVSAVLFARPLTASQTLPAEPVSDTAPVSMAMVDRLPGFMDGSTDEFVRWVYSAIEYPASAREAGVGARVVVSFIIRSNGEVSDVRTLELEPKGNVPGDFDYSVFSDAVINVVKQSPRWTPGMMDGKPVNVTYSFPVSFITRI